MFAYLERLCLALRFVVSGVVILLFSVMMISVLVQVGGRYVFNYSIAQASEIATFSQIWLVLLGSGVAVARGQHVAIDMLPAKLPLPATMAEAQKLAEHDRRFITPPFGRKSKKRHRK